MITKLTLNNFKSISEQTYEFSQFDLFVGQNNSGKSTILQALAIWQFCVDEFNRAKHRKNKSIQIVLPNFTALPIPQFNLLWKERTERRYVKTNGSKKPERILIYASPQTLYAIPIDGWEPFKQLQKNQLLPSIAYVPPFSGLEDSEEWRDEAPLRKQIDLEITQLVDSPIIRL